jgi:hypothetical protein
MIFAVLWNFWIGFIIAAGPVVALARWRGHPTRVKLLGSVAVVLLVYSMWLFQSQIAVKSLGNFEEFVLYGLSSAIVAIWTLIADRFHMKTGGLWVGTAVSILASAACISGIYLHYPVVPEASVEPRRPLMDGCE